MNDNPIDLSKFCKDIIHGTGGFKDYEDHEIPVFEDRDVAIVEFTVRCLANLECENSHAAVIEIINQRMKLKKDQLIFK